jgi:hypothetical protein
MSSRPDVCGLSRLTLYSSDNLDALTCLDLRLPVKHAIQELVTCAGDSVKRSWRRDEPRAAAAGTRKSPSTAYDLKFVCSDLRAKAKCALSLDIEPISIRGGKAPLLSYRSASIFAKLCYVEHNFETSRHSAEVS